MSKGQIHIDHHESLISLTICLNRFPKPKPIPPYMGNPQWYPLPVSVFDFTDGLGLNYYPYTWVSSQW